MSEFHTINEVINRAFRLIDRHELIRYPVVFNTAGSPVRITEYRDHDGYDTNPKGLTLGIFPYTYASSSLTVDTVNAPLVFKPLALGDSNGGNEKGTLNLVVKLYMMGNAITEEALAENRPVLKKNVYEDILRDWLDVLRTILLSNPIQSLAGWVKNSRVNYGNFESTDSRGSKGENYVLHKASLIWQMDNYPPRDLKAFPYSKVDGYTLGWTYVGLRTNDSMDIYWDGDRKDLYTLTGYPLRSTPTDVPVTWDPTESRFEHRTTGAALTVDQLKDPEDPEKPWIDTDLRIVGLVFVPATDMVEAYYYSIYLKKSAKTLQKADGTALTELPDGSPIGWDDVNEKLSVTEKDAGTQNLYLDLADPKSKSVIIRVADTTGKRGIESVRIA